MALANPYIHGDYDSDQMIFLKNPWQSCVFAKYIKLYDAIPLRDGFVFAFDKDDFRKLQSKWHKHELNPYPEDVE